MNVIRNNNKILIIYRILYDAPETEEIAVFIRMIVITLKGKIIPEMRINGTYHKKENEINIGDIQIYDQINCGYGTFMIKELNKIAESQNVNIITGWISPRDWGHIERLKNFYQKNGFLVDLDNENNTGSIKWEKQLE